MELKLSKYKASGIFPEIKLRQCAVFLLIPCGQGLCRTVREWKLPKTISRYRLPQCAVGQRYLGI